MSELGAGTRRALAACLYDAGFTGVARLIAEDTTDVYQCTAAEALDATGGGFSGSGRGATDAVREAGEMAAHSGRAQLVLVTPDGEGEWLKPELVPVVHEVLDAALHAKSGTVERDGDTTRLELHGLGPADSRGRYPALRWSKVADEVDRIEGYLAPVRNRGVGYISTDAAGPHAREYPPSTPQVLDIMRQTLERGR